MPMRLGVIIAACGKCATPFNWKKFTVTERGVDSLLTDSLPGLYSGKTLDNRAGGRGFKPRSSQTEN